MTAAPGATLDDIEHIVILMQENRSFDEYFGTMSDVVGFSDPDAQPGVFMQAGGNNAEGGTNVFTLPWHFDTTRTDAQSTGGLDHSWPVQHLMWAEGAMNAFVIGQENESVTMGYFERSDIPYHFALADAWTVCDHYHCSVFGPTNPNRIVHMSGTIDPDGTMGGPVTDNSSTNGQLMWQTVPETLQAAGVDWYLYQEDDNYGDNMLPFFTGFQDTTTDLYRRGNSFIPSTSLLGEATAAAIKADVMNGTLPQVSWIVGAAETTEHPDYTPGRGAQFIDQILEALTSDLDVWAKTLLIINYDENDGHFDHVVPPTPPVGTADEYVYTPEAETPPVPVGLGFRVPCILVSPFTVGPLVSSVVFDHTSVIQLLETKFDVTCPNISAWRRATVGNLLEAVNFAGTPSTAVPALPDADQLAADAVTQESYPTPYPPAVQAMPTQETTPSRGTPSGLVAVTTPPPGLGESELPAVLPVAAAVGLGILALRTRTRRAGQPDRDPG